MFKSANRSVMVRILLLSALLALPLSAPVAQERKLVYENWYAETKKELAAHYTGKTVKLRLAIPSTRRGLEVTDGTLPTENPAQAQAQPGEEVTIRSFKVGVSNIELLLNKTGGKRPNRFFGWMKRPRINLRFSRFLTFLAFLAFPAFLALPQLRPELPNPVTERRDVRRGVEERSVALPHEERLRLLSKSLGRGFDRVPEHADRALVFPGEPFF